MNYTHDNLKSKILGRIFLIFLGRKLKETTVWAPIVSLAGIIYIAITVSLRDVFLNMQSVTNLEGFIAFQKSAIQNTEIAVQAAFTLAVLALFLVGLEFVKKVKFVSASSV